MERGLSMPAETEEEKKLKIDTVKAIYTRLGVDRMAQEEIVRLTDEALDSARNIGLDEEKFSLLKNFADNLIGRKN